MRRQRTEVPELDVLLERWRGGESVTQLMAATGYSRAVLDDRLKAALYRIGKREVLRILADANEELGYSGIRAAIGEKRMNLVEVMNGLRVCRLVVERDIPGAEPKVYRVDGETFSHMPTYFRLTAEGWAAVKEMEREEGEKHCV